MNFMIQSLKKIKFFTIYAIALLHCASVFGAASSSSRGHGGKLHYLIFGANEANIPDFDKAFKGTGVEWQGFDLTGPFENKIIKGDFNDLESLALLPDHYYDAIYFDYSTTKFTNWTDKHLAILKQKLKDPGLLFIPQSGPGLISRVDDRIKKLEGPYKEAVRKDNVLRDIIKEYEKDHFRNGVYAPEVSASTNPNYSGINVYIKASHIEAALQKLKEQFGTAVFIQQNASAPDLYPPTTRNISDFYIAGKIEGSLEETYKMLISPVTHKSLSLPEINEAAKYLTNELKEFENNYNLGTPTDMLRMLVENAINILQEPGDLIGKIYIIEESIKPYGFFSRPHKVTKSRVNVGEYFDDIIKKTRSMIK